MPCHAYKVSSSFKIFIKLFLKAKQVFKFKHIISFTFPLRTLFKPKPAKTDSQKTLKTTRWLPIPRPKTFLTLYPEKLSKKICNPY